MSIQTLETSGWVDSAAWTAVRRTVMSLAVVVILAGPIAVGGVLGWMMTREAGPMLGDDGWLRTRAGTAKTAAGFPLVSTAELEAAGSTLDEARRILRR